MAAAIRLSQQHSCSFAHFVGPGDEHIRQRNAERSRRLEVYCHVKARRLLDRHVGRLCAARDLIHIARDVVEQPHEVESIADQRTGLGVLPVCRDRRNATFEQCLCDSRAVAQEYRTRRQDDRLPADIVHCAKCATVALLAFDFDHARLQAQLAGCLSRCIALLSRKRVKCDSDDSRARECLASNLDAFGGESSWRTKMPVTLPPGCERLATYPFARGSKSTARNAIGLPSAAESAARSAGSFPPARNTSTLRAASSR